MAQVKEPRATPADGLRYLPLIAMTLDIHRHVSLGSEKQAAAKLNAALTSGLLWGCCKLVGYCTILPAQNY